MDVLVDMFLKDAPGRPILIPHSVPIFYLFRFMPA